ncbi:MAG TPA: hypothetical protein VG755_04770 [Nannocystaceae bacterium]|nr:hypothetical protein [Nannocystaceae bacterium]
MPVEPSALAVVSVEGDRLRVALHRVIADISEAERLQEEIERRATAGGVAKVLFDYRKVGSHDEAVRTSMWDWAARTSFVAMALIVANDLTRVRMNMTAVAQKVRMRAFLHEPDAVGWLEGAERRRPTTEITKI